MGLPHIFRSVFLAPAVRQVSLLPPECTATATVSLPAVTVVNSLTLTYTGPFTAGGSPSSPFTLTTTTYTITIPSQKANGEITTQTYTIIGAPLGDPQGPAPTVTAQCPTPSPQAPNLSPYFPPNPYVGCIEDSQGTTQGLLDGPTRVVDTQESCKAFCTTTRGGPFKYFAIKSGSDCCCGNQFLHPPVYSPGGCDTACSGNETQECGGSDSYSVWGNAGRLTTGPSHQPALHPPYSSPAGDGVLEGSLDDVPYDWLYPAEDEPDDAAPPEPVNNSTRDRVRDSPLDDDDVGNLVGEAGGVPGSEYESYDSPGEEGDADLDVNCDE